MTQPELGIIEGYFGRTWTWPERKAVVSCLAPAGYKFFHYAPKNDRKLRRDWKELLAPEFMNEIVAFKDHCHSFGMRFGIGLTPYGAHLDFGTETKQMLARKIDIFNSIGIDDLIILFDDMRGDVANLAEKQSEIMAFCLDQSRAHHFYFCPSYYSDDPVLDRVFGKRPLQYLEMLGKNIDPVVHIYWTGEEVCSAAFSLGHLRNVAERLGRNVCLWDNYPVNDGPRMSQHLHLRGFTGRTADIAYDVTGHAINPASQPVLSCIPALTLAASYRQAENYQYGKAFMEAATAVVGIDLAVMLRDDLLSFQNTGLDRLGESKHILRKKYAAVHHPAALEIIDWLDGGYAITGEMLETQ